MFDIEASEKRGQEALVENCDRLPFKGFHNTNGCVETYKKLGIEIVLENGQPKIVEDIFIEVKLPDGWKLIPSHHSMWSYLVDDKGRERMAVFYKAAFYDRSAHANLKSRFNLERDYDCDTHIVYRVTKDKTQVFEAKRYEKSGDHKINSANQSEAEAECRNWLAEKYPNWGDPFAYWDIE